MKIIVLCTGNSCRSQIAEGLLKSKYPDYEIHSAGTKPELNVNPYAIRAMKDVNIDISNNYPKLVDDFVDQEFDYVLTVCDSANEICPTFHNAKNKIHNSIKKPAGLITKVFQIFNNGINDRRSNKLKSIRYFIFHIFNFID